MPETNNTPVVLRRELVELLQKERSALYDLLLLTTKELARLSPDGNTPEEAEKLLSEIVLLATSIVTLTAEAQSIGLSADQRRVAEWCIAKGDLTSGGDPIGYVLEKYEEARAELALRDESDYVESVPTRRPIQTEKRIADILTERDYVAAHYATAARFAAKSTAGGDPIGAYQFKQVSDDWARRLEDLDTEIEAERSSLQGRIERLKLLIAQRDWGPEDMQVRRRQRLATFEGWLAQLPAIQEAA